MIISNFPTNVEFTLFLIESIRREKERGLQETRNPPGFFKNY